MKIEHEKTKEALKWFEEISKIPRCSKNEEKIALWLVDWAKKNNFEAEMDSVKNTLIKVPASPGYENSPTVIIQGHMDMVCEKTPDSNHDFTKDPIKFVFEGEWLTADKTTLGADNGIAIAMAMAMALDKELEHPPLELFFTVDEETGLTGVNELQPGFLDGKILINIDSEDEGVFTVGCAGGINTYLSLPSEYEDVPAGYKKFKINAGGMKGGHSGIDIALGKANAIKIVSRALRAVIKEEIDLRIADIKGGSAHNAIPRDAWAVVFVPEKDQDNMKEIILRSSETFNSEFKCTDPDLFVTVEDSEEDYDKLLTAGKTRETIDFISVIPHGVAFMSPDIEGLVETSNNLANVSINSKEKKIDILTSQRSAVISRLNAHTDGIEAVARLAGGDAYSSDGYPPWQPNMASPLLDRSKKLYEKLFKKEPVVEIIHAGLECGIIGDKYPGMDMISIGPTLKYPHCPDEKIHVGTIGKIWDFIAALLKDLK
ncbi:MAG: aminoacyl-histidine dipeptidase [Candidatus Aminicenantes bacterium]|nr:aminoacyl-histidine dipeptidase [Candidatus Aminicenantes bacterium]